MHTSWIDLQISNDAHSSWYNQYAQPRLPQKPYTLREITAKTIDQGTYIEPLAVQNPLHVADINPFASTS